jgi:hypothetical protein
MPQYLVAVHHPDTYVPSLEDEAMIRDTSALNQEMIVAGVRRAAVGSREAGCSLTRCHACCLGARD